jgi:cytochrome c
MQIRSCLLVLVPAVSLFVCVEICSAEGDPSRGEGLYAVCATCHGQNGEGIREMNGPALAGH